MHCQGRIAVVQAAGVGEYDSSAQEGVAHNKTEKRSADFFRAREGKGKKNIHGDAAQLKREIPPVVCPVPENKCEKTLLPYLAAQHEHAAQEKNPVRQPGKIRFDK